MSQGKYKMNLEHPVMSESEEVLKKMEACQKNKNKRTNLKELPVAKNENT